MIRKSIIAVFTSICFVALGLFVSSPAQAETWNTGICTIRSNNPTASASPSGSISGTGSVSCTSTMAELFVKVTVQKSTGASWTGAASDRFNSSYVSASAAISCSQGPGTYRTRTSYVIYGSPGNSPSYVSSYLDTPYVNLACGVPFRSSPLDQEPESVSNLGSSDTITFNLR